MGMDVDQAWRDNLAARIDRFPGVARNVGLDRYDPAARYRQITRRVEPGRWIDDASAPDDKIVGRRECPWNMGERRSAGGANLLASVHHGRYPPA
jgi:hypothetical protein